MPLPPGNTGLPLLGETLEFLKDGFGFVERRAVRYGPVFRTRLFGRKTAVIVGPDASGEFIDSRHVQREGAMLPHIQELFGGHSLPTLDGDKHLERKRFVLAGFTREAFTSYVPTLQRLVAGALERWTGAGEMGWLDEFKRLSLEAICATMMGMPPGPKMDRLREDYDIVGGGFSSLPIPLPGTSYTRAKKALGRILKLFEETIHEHRKTPREDGLSLILAAKSPVTGGAITVPEARIELHHVIVAGLIVWAWLVTSVLELDRNPKVRQRLVEEIRRMAPKGTLTVERLDQMTYLDRFTMEVRRVSPVVPVFFGKAREGFEFKGATVPAGWMVLWGARSSHLRDEIYANPDRFDPDRFSPERAEHKKHEHAFVPNGAGPPTGHKCAGYEFAPCFLKVFNVELLRDYAWQLTQPQDFDYDWRRIPPEPKGGLKVRLQRAVF